MFDRLEFINFRLTSSQTSKKVYTENFICSKESPSNFLNAKNRLHPIYLVRLKLIEFGSAWIIDRPHGNVEIKLQ